MFVALLIRQSLIEKLDVTLVSKAVAAKKTRAATKFSSPGDEFAIVASGVGNAKTGLPIVYLYE
ncbi:hypothetical protein BV375_16730 [Nostoc sp. 106C]|nr:hypothetical protein BV375_16730 [Nostoc sp. 106C]